MSRSFKMVIVSCVTLLVAATLTIAQPVSSSIPAAQAATKAGETGNNEDKITVCHVPPGNPANAQTITIDRSAWRADGQGSGGHGPGLHGGDYEGPCKTEGNNTPIAATQTSGGDHKILICHVPPGNPANAQTLSIDEHAWKADGSGPGGHGPGLHCGDYLGPCKTEWTAVAT